MIFGSHNSGTYGDINGCCSCIISSWTQNQTLTITEQLDRGVRWFDLRLSFSPTDGEVYLSHTYLTNNTLSATLNDFEQFLERDPRGELLLIHLRVDFNDRANASVIQTRVNTMLEYYKGIFLERSQIVSSLEAMLTHKKAILYCSDGTLQHPLICAMDLMPTLYFWDAGTVEECERRLIQMEDEFKKQLNGPYLFSDRRMILFDYSTTAPLWFTDRKQDILMERYAHLIKRADILAGNQIQKIMERF
jgi:hypothetical protein